MYYSSYEDTVDTVYWDQLQTTHAAKAGGLHTLSNTPAKNCKLLAPASYPRDGRNRPSRADYRHLIEATKSRLRNGHIYYVLSDDRGGQCFSIDSSVSN